MWEEKSENKKMWV